MLCKNCNYSEAVKYSKWSAGNFCSKTCAKSYATKSKRKEISKKVSKTLTAPLQKSICRTCGKEFEHKQYKKRKYCSVKCSQQEWLPATIDKLTEHAKRIKFGGHTSKNSIYYKMKCGNVVYLHSSYEERVARSLDDNNVNWIRPEPLVYIGGDGKEHRYYADFFLVDSQIYLDPKNDYLIKKDKDKIARASAQNNKQIVVLNKDQLDYKSIISAIDNYLAESRRFKSFIAHKQSCNSAG